ncbi:D-inositol 3-phosphate glycosyltransferase [Stylophora pistillata]|uniref:D-inositol 3-phosphate glycosyltransferase n=1 Tax=Stylophora pistillata TaxID=50429 RepID=A0A2B4SV91_STYPI|nr:D-inositol 3-phosphate glycosyltransferase [Stylophora pistillata]
MACSSVSTAASSEEEKKEQRLIDVMFLCDEWKSSKGGLSTFNREFAIKLAETTTGSMEIHCYVSKSDNRDREDAKQHAVNLITAETVPGSLDPLDWLKVPPPELQHPHVVIGHGRKLGTPACHIVRAVKCKWIQFVHVFCEDVGKFKDTTATAVTDRIEENEVKRKMEIELCKAADAVVAVGCRLQQKYSRSLPKDELKGMFHESDLVAIPSCTEGFGLVALEAISSGVPVLVSGESGVAEALQEVEGGNSVIVESDDDDVEWARRISEVSSQSPDERDTKARQLRENYRKVYSWRKECETFKGLVENVVKTADADGKSNVKVDVEHVKLADHDSSSTPSVSTMEPAGCQKASTPPGTNSRKRQSDTDLGDLQPLKEKILCRIAMNYLDTTPPQSSEEHNKFMEYLKKMRVVITGVSVGSLVITVKCDSLKSLEELWEDYSCSLLNKMVQDCFVTVKILKELNLTELKLKTTMDTEEYNACKVYFGKDAIRGQ